MKKSRLINIIIGPLLLILCATLLPDSIFTSFGSKAAVGTVLWMAYWWLTAPLDYAITGLLPIAVNALLQITDMSTIISNYASETILLLFGASILTASWERTGLDKRIAVTFLRFIGNKFRTQLLFWFMLSFLLSAVLPNAVVCATVTPIAVAMLSSIGHSDVKKSKYASKILLTVAYATGLGGLASPLGGAMNLVTVDYIQQLTGDEYMYTSWVIRFLPIVIVLLIINIIFMLRDVKSIDTLGGSKEYLIEQYNNLPKMSFEEKISLSLFIIATVLSFTRQFYEDLLPGLKPAYVFIICAIISFLITNKDGERLMIWKNVQTKIVWEMIYIFAGGLAVGSLINSSGAAEDIGAYISTLNLDGGYLTVLIIITVTIILSDVTSNTATAAVAIPIVISIINGIDKNPIPYIYIASVGVNLSYMLPTSIRAIPVGYGLQPKYMFKEGWKITVAIIIVMSVFCYLLLKYWEAFSGV